MLNLKLINTINGVEVSEFELDKWLNYLLIHNIEFSWEIDPTEFSKVITKERLDISDEDLAYLEDDSVECRYKEELHEKQQEENFERVLNYIDKLDEKRLAQLKKEFDI